MHLHLLGPHVGEAGRQQVGDELVHEGRIVRVCVCPCTQLQCVNALKPQHCVQVARCTTLQLMFSGSKQRTKGPTLGGNTPERRVDDVCARHGEQVVQDARMHLKPRLVEGVCRVGVV